MEPLPAPTALPARTARRSLLLVIAAGMAGSPLAQAQNPRAKRLAWLSSGVSREDSGTKPIVDIVVGELRAKGWTLGKDYVIEFRFVQGDPRRYPALADELIAWQPDVLYGLETAARVLVTKTRSIPIVMATSLDPVGAGLVKSLARPGTNVTGMSGQTDLLVAKQVELLTELVPRARRIALLFDPTWAGQASAEQHFRAAVRAKGLDPSVAPVTDEASVRAAFAQFEQERVEGIVESPTPSTIRLGRAIREGALRLRLPIVGQFSSGAVLEYGQDYADQFRQSADFIDQLFRGANPAELPVRQANRFVLNINQQAAREIGIQVPFAILVRANKVIE